MANTTQGPAITSASIPRPPTQPAPIVPPLNATAQATANKTAAFAMDNSPIIAAPLIEPDFVNLKPTNPNITFRWILHTLFMKDGNQSILRFEQAKAQGYVVAVKADVVNPPVAYERDGGTKYINGDLILMKIDRRKYLGAILDREKKAVRAMQSTRSKGKQAVDHAASVLPSGQRSKISTFDPTDDLKRFADEGTIEKFDDE